MKKNSLLLLSCIILFATESFGQGDSLHAERSGMYNALRVGVGVEKAPYLELGYSRIGIVDKGWAGSLCFYAAGQVNVSTQEENGRYIMAAKPDLKPRG